MIKKPDSQTQVATWVEEFAGYEEFLRDVKARVQTAQVRAALAVNRELVLLYWSIGADISRHMQSKGWGAKVVDRLSTDLCQEFPTLRGFSPRNLRYMRSFAEAWSDEAILPQAAAKIPWFHNCVLLDKLSQTEERLRYARQTVEHGWSRNVLVHQIESKLYKRQGKAVTNFDRALPSPESDLVAKHGMTCQALQLRKEGYHGDTCSIIGNITA